ncbi:RNA polymerase sigma factor [Flavobacterium rhizosphaerae]|uniref:Sigma-70 family RNA polymerase sigma factor n=1 Tax=Flavobacterium rhizosphaerae TaxID=3163298 RepID=A0ABW8Z0X6_9FLAO
MEVNPDIISQNIAKAKTGDQVAFTYLLDRFWNEVYGFMLKRTQNETDTEDIVIETFAKAFDRIQTYNPDYVFSTWLIAIAKNVHIDLLRKKKSSHQVELSEGEQRQVRNIPDDALSPEDSLIKDQNLSSLLHCIKQLKPQYQEVIQLRYFQELTYQEISAQLNEPLNSVKVKLLRAKKLLSEIIRKK